MAFILHRTCLTAPIRVVLLLFICFPSCSVNKPEVSQSLSLVGLLAVDPCRPVSSPSLISHAPLTVSPPLPSLLPWQFEPFFSYNILGRQGRKGQQQFLQRARAQAFRLCRPLAASLFFFFKTMLKKGETILGSKAIQKQAKASLGPRAIVSQLLLKVLNFPISTLLAAS